MAIEYQPFRRFSAQTMQQLRVELLILMLIMYLIQTVSRFNAKRNIPSTKYCGNCGFLLVEGMANKRCYKLGEESRLLN